MGKAQSLFCSRAHSPFCSSFSKQWTPFLGGVQERKWGHPRVAYVCASVRHTPTSGHAQCAAPLRPPPIAAPMASHPLERTQAGPMTEELSGGPRSRLWRAGGEVIGIAGCGSRK